jgi:hypothetical protein
MTTFLPLTSPGQASLDSPIGLVPDVPGIPALGNAITLGPGATASVQNGMLVVAVNLTSDQSAFLGQYPMVQDTIALVTGLLARSDAYSIQGRQAMGRLCLDCARALWGLTTALLPTSTPAVAALISNVLVLCRQGGIMGLGQAYTASGQGSPSWTSAVDSALTAIEGYDPGHPAPQSVLPPWGSLLSTITRGVTLPPIVPA